MKKLKELLSDTLIYGISSVGARFLNYLLVPFYTKYFAPGAYGIIGLIYSAVGFLNILFQFGMESAYLRYAADRDKAGDVYKTLQFGLFGVSTALALVVWLIKPFALPYLGLTAETENLYLMMIAILWLDALGIVPFAELRLNRQAMTFAGVKLFHVLVNLALNFYLVIGLDWGLEAVLVSNLVASLVATVMVILLTYRRWKGTSSSPIFLKALKFGLPFVPTGVGYAINEFLDRFFLNAMEAGEVESVYGAGYTSDAITGIYNACYKLAIFMPLLVQMFRMAWQPFFLRNADNPDARNLFADVFLYFNAGAALLFLGISLFAEYIVQIRIPILDATIIDSRYWMGLNVVPLLLLAYWFQGWYTNFTAGIFIKEKTSLLPYITLFGAGLTIVANIILVPRFGMMGAATATLLSYSSMALLLYAQTRRIYRVPYSFRRTLPVMGMAVALYYLFDYTSVLPWVTWLNALLIFVAGVTATALLTLTKRDTLKRLKRFSTGK